MITCKVNKVTSEERRASERDVSVRFNDESHQKSLSETLRSFCYTRGRDASSGPEMKPKGETNIVSDVSLRASEGAAVRRAVLKR